MIVDMWGLKPLVTLASLCKPPCEFFYFEPAHSSAASMCHEAFSAPRPEAPVGGGQEESGEHDRQYPPPSTHGDVTVHEGKSMKVSLMTKKLLYYINLPLSYLPLNDRFSFTFSRMDI